MVDQSTNGSTSTRHGTAARGGDDGLAGATDERGVRLGIGKEVQCSAWLTSTGLRRPSGVLADWFRTGFGYEGCVASGGDLA